MLREGTRATGLADPCRTPPELRGSTARRSLPDCPAGRPVACDAAQSGVKWQTSEHPSGSLLEEKSPLASRWSVFVASSLGLCLSGWGAAHSAVTWQPGFDEEVVVQGLDKPTAVAYAADG